MSLNREELIKNLEAGVDGVEVGEAALLLEILKKTDKTKQAVQTVMEGTIDPEKLEWLGKILDKGYARNMSTLKEFGLYDEENPKENDKKAPTLGEVKEKVLSSITLGQMEVILGMERPVLLLVPNTSLKRYLEALDSKKPIKGQINAHVIEWIIGVLKRADEYDISAWDWAIVESERELPPPKDNNELLEARIKTFENENEGKDVNGMDLRQYILLQMQALLEGKPIDNQYYWTILNGEPVKDSYVAGGAWFGDRVKLGRNNVGDQADRGRFRPSPKGRI